MNIIQLFYKKTKIITGASNEFKYYGFFTNRETKINRGY